MTDNEIMEALKACTTQDGSIPCYDCPCWCDDTQKCVGLNYTEVLGLINRQKAEIEELSREFEHDFEKMESEYDSNIKAEAYKEFAEKLKTACEEIIKQSWNQKAAPVSWSHAYENFIDDIDNLLEEVKHEY